MPSAFIEAACEQPFFELKPGFLDREVTYDFVMRAGPEGRIVVHRPHLTTDQVQQLQMAIDGARFRARELTVAAEVQGMLPPGARIAGLGEMEEHD